MATFAMTYDVVTPESAEQGDVGERGWHTERTEIGRGAEQIRLKTAIRLARNESCSVDNGDGSFYSNGGDMNYRTGAETSYAVHFGGLTPATLRRVSRALARR